MFTGESFIRFLVFLLGLVIVILTLSSAISTIVLPRAARSQLNRLVFGLLRRAINFILHFAKTYQLRDAIMAYYAPIGLMLLVPTWYILIMLGYAAMYWALGVGDIVAVFRLSGSSILTLGFEPPDLFITCYLLRSNDYLMLSPPLPICRRCIHFSGEQGEYA
jgi:hypothetical protein